MTTINFICGDSIHSVDAPEDTTAMWNALQNGVNGIVGECGGDLSCASCHVYVPEAWQDMLSSPSLAESELLEVLDSHMPNSRLSCQIIVKPDLEGLTLEVAPQN